MRFIRSTLAGCLVAALLVTSLAASAVTAPAKGKMSIVQGRTGALLDVCVNGKEIESRLRFGGRVFRNFGPGPKVLKFFRAAPGSCRGTKIAQRTVRFPRGSDLTIVVGRRSPKVLVFDNNGAPPSRLPASDLVFRHAADYRGVTFRQRIDELPDDPVEPAAEAEPLIWKRGREGWGSYPLLAGQPLEWATTWVSEELPHWPDPVRAAAPKFTMMAGHARYEWIFIGHADKTRLLVLKRR